MDKTRTQTTISYSTTTVYSAWARKPTATYEQPPCDRQGGCCMEHFTHRIKDIKVDQNGKHFPGSMKKIVKPWACRCNSIFQWETLLFLFFLLRTQPLHSTPASQTASSYSDPTAAPHTHTTTLHSAHYTTHTTVCLHLHRRNCREKNNNHASTQTESSNSFPVKTSQQASKASITPTNPT